MSDKPTVPIAVAVYGCPICRSDLEKRQGFYGQPYIQCTGCDWSCEYEARIQALVQQLAELTCEVPE